MANLCPICKKEETYYNRMYDLHLSLGELGFEERRAHPSCLITYKQKLEALAEKRGIDFKQLVKDNRM